MPVDPVTADPPGRPILFYAPHADDETLFMAQVIAHHALAGREVHVVLCSNGETSGALAQINGTATSSWWGGFHYPAREGYAPLTPAEFGQARTAEFVAACAQLGVPRERVHCGQPDGALAGYQLPAAVTPGWAESVFTSWAAYFADVGAGSVGHYTMWWGDPHPDHAALGTALRNLHHAQPAVFGDVRWLVKPDQAAAAGAGVYGLPASLTGQIKQMARRAGWCYRAWQPAAGAYAVGYHSVPPLFAAVEAGDPNYIVSA